MAKDELWRGQQNHAIRSRFFGTPKDGEKSQSFSDHDQKTLADLEQRDHQFSIGKPSTQERMARRMQKADEGIRQRVEDALRDEELNPTPEQDYVARLMTFDRQMGFMPEKPRSQVEKLANAITREFNLNGQESTEATTGITANPEVLLTNTTKDLLKTFTPENILVLAPLTLALMVVRAMPPEVKATLKHWYEKMPANTRRVLVLMMATVILAGCSAMAGTPNKEVDPGNNNDPVAGETTGAPSEEAATEEAATEEAATEEVIQDPNYKISLKVTPEVNESIDRNPLLQNLSEEERAEIPPACVDFAKKLEEGRNGDSYIDIYSSDNIFSVITIGQETICQVVTGDGSIILDIWNDKGPIYITTQGASDALGTNVDHISTDGYYGNLADAYDSEGRHIGGINMRVLQWERVDETGNLPSVSNPESVLPTPINPGPEAYQITSAVSMDGEQIEELIKKTVIGYENGTITDEEIGLMSFEQQQAFAIALDNERDKQNGESEVSFTDESGKKQYLGEDGKFHPEKQTFEGTLPKVTDREGYIHIFHEGSWIKIEGSQSIQYDNFENFPWPKTELTKVLDEKDKHPLTMPEWMFKVSDGSQMSMVPVIILSKEIGEFNIVDWGETGAITAYIPNENDPYSVHRAKVIGNATLYTDGVTAKSSGEIDELSTFWQKLEENTLYYLVIFTDQKAGIAKTYPDTKGREITATYQGFAPTSQTTDIITGKIQSDNMVVIDTHTFVKKLGE